MAFVLWIPGCPRPASPPSLTDREEAAEQIQLYRQALLDPARIAPPSISFAPQEVEVGPVRAVASPLRPESASWNQWQDGGARLFNNRLAILFDVRVEGPEPVYWLPGGTRLELNDDRTVLRPVGTEGLLLQLIEFGVLEEAFALEGDLVDRTRAAGPFRSAYLPARGEEGVLEGVVGFPLINDQGLLADMHVVALRLTLAVEAAGEVHELVWVFE